MPNSSSNSSSQSSVFKFISNVRLALLTSVTCPLSARQPPDQKRVDRAEQYLAPSRASRKLRITLQQVSNLGPENTGPIAARSCCAPRAPRRRSWAARKSARTRGSARQSPGRRAYPYPPPTARSSRVDWWSRSRQLRTRRQPPAEWPRRRLWSEIPKSVPGRVPRCRAAAESVETLVVQPRQSPPIDQTKWRDSKSSLVQSHHKAFHPATSSLGLRPTRQDNAANRHRRPARAWASPTTPPALTHRGDDAIFAPKDTVFAALRPSVGGSPAWCQTHNGRRQITQLAKTSGHQKRRAKMRRFAFQRHAAVADGVLRTSAITHQSRPARTSRHQNWVVRAAIRLFLNRRVQLTDSASRCDAWSRWRCGEFPPDCRHIAGNPSSAIIRTPRSLSRSPCPTMGIETGRPNIVNAIITARRVCRPDDLPNGEGSPWYTAT